MRRILVWSNLLAGVAAGSVILIAELAIVQPAAPRGQRG
jgi:hypothetical protein